MPLALGVQVSGLSSRCIQPSARLLPPRAITVKLNAASTSSIAGIKLNTGISLSNALPQRRRSLTCTASAAAAPSEGKHPCYMSIVVSNDNASPRSDRSRSFSTFLHMQLHWRTLRTGSLH